MYLLCIDTWLLKVMWKQIALRRDIAQKSRYLKIRTKSWLTKICKKLLVLPWRLLRFWNWEQHDLGFGHSVSTRVNLCIIESVFYFCFSRSNYLFRHCIQFFGTWVQVWPYLCLCFLKGCSSSTSFSFFIHFRLVYMVWHIVCSKTSVNLSLFKAIMRCYALIVAFGSSPQWKCCFHVL